jgi:hypothetical protein
MAEQTLPGGTQVSANDGPHQDWPIEASQATTAHPEADRRPSTAEANSASQGAPPAPSTSAAAPAFLEANFPPIADYGFLSDCENTCLIAPTGAVEWFCLPAPHDPSIMGAILDRSAGRSAWDQPTRQSRQPGPICQERWC